MNGLDTERARYYLHCFNRALLPTTERITMDPNAILAIILDPSTGLAERAEAIRNLEAWLDGGGFVPTIDSEQVDRLTNHLEAWANAITPEAKYLLNGWTGSQDSMTYALVSSNGLKRGSVRPNVESSLEWLATLWGKLETELRKDIVPAVQANPEAPSEPRSHENLLLTVQRIERMLDRLLEAL